MLTLTGNSLFAASGALKRVPQSSVPQGKAYASLSFTPSAPEVVSRWVQLPGGSLSLFCHPLLWILTICLNSVQLWLSVPGRREKPLDIRCMFLSKVLVLHTAMLSNNTFLPLLQPPHPSLEPMWWRAQPSHDLLRVRHLLSCKAQS